MPVTRWRFEGSKNILRRSCHICNFELQCNQIASDEPTMTDPKKPRKSEVISLRLDSPQMSRLSRLARQANLTASETAARLIEEGLRRAEFSHIDFRSSPRGRNAYVTGSRLSIPEVILIAKGCKYDVNKTASYLGWPTFKVQAAFNYWHAFKEEVDLAIEDLESVSFQSLKNKLPQMEVFEWGKTSSKLVSESENVYSTTRDTKSSKSTGKSQLRKSPRKK